MKEIIIKVDGMMCKGCENRIQNSLKNVDGIENVIANHKTGEVKITLQNELNECIIKEKIEDIGFKVVN